MFYINDIPYLRVVKKIISLPKGEPLGVGNCIFPITTSLTDTFSIIEDKSNLLISSSKYRYFFHNFVYHGNISGRRFNINDLKKREKVYEEIENTLSILKKYPTVNLTQNTTYNMFYDISRYMEIFFSITENFTMNRKMTAFWDYLDTIINNPMLSKFDTKTVIIDIKMFHKIGSSIKENMKNPAFLLYYALQKDINLVKRFNMNFIFYTGQNILKINPSFAEEHTYRMFLMELKKLYKFISVDIGDHLDEDKINKEELTSDVTDTVASSMNFTGDKPIDTVITSIDDIEDVEGKDAIKDINKVVKSAVDSSDNEEEVVDKVDEKINADDAMIRELYRATKKYGTVKSAASSARDKMLREKQQELVVKGLTVKELQELNVNNVTVPTRNVSNVVKTTNENMKKIRFANMDETYINKVMTKDITNAFMELNTKSLPLFIRNIKVEDTSNELNYVETYTVELEDGNRQRSTIKVDIPKFIDNKFMWLGGNKKIILTQNFLLPLIKSGPDTVQLVTNYNKMFITRDDTKSIGPVERMYKILSTNDNFRKCFKMGNSFGINSDKITTIEFDELSKAFSKYQFKDCVIYFDLSKSEPFISNKKIPPNTICIGKENGEPILINTETQTDGKGRTIVEIILNNAPSDVREKFNSIKTPKRNMYAKVKTMEKNVPVIVLLCFWEGLSEVLKKMDVKYRLSTSYPSDMSIDEDTIRFKDCYLVYDNSASNSLLMSGLKYVNTLEYELATMDLPDPYLTIFKKIYGKMSIANALDNTYEFTIDHLTKESLVYYNLPTDIVSLMIHGVRLLADNQYVSDLNEGSYRVRRAEIISAILYDTLAKNYITYKNSTGRKKLSIPRDSVIKKLVELKTVEDYSTLNPVLEMERTHSINNKGWRGVNLDYSYTVPKRSYDSSMAGIIGIATSPDGSVGVARTLTLEPMIDNVRGYPTITPDSEQTKVLKDVNIFSPGEMSVPLMMRHDDPTRIGHALKQAKHVIPVKQSSPVLISNGLEEIARFHLSSDFVINAKMDGKVIEMDAKTKIMVVEYSNGEHQAVNLAGVIVKNGGGGFFINNILVTDLEVGNKFKANDVLAWNKDFFTKNINGCRMNLGTLVKVAFTSTYNTHQDATYVTEKLSEDAATDMVFQRQVDIGKNANVSHILKIGDHVEIGDSLVKFDTSFDDGSLNEFLAVLSKDPRLEAEVIGASTNDIKSETAGIIEDIKIYSAVELSELSPTLKEIVSSYYRSINKRKSLLKKYDDSDSIIRCGMMIAEPTKRVEPNKYGVIRGKKAEDSVIIEFYIKHTELLETGSKIANYTALKNTICERIPAGYEPYSDFRPEEEVSTIIASNSVLKRMVPSLLLVAFGNKCIIELKHSVKKIYDTSKQNVPLCRKAIEKLIYGFFKTFDKTGNNVKKYKSIFEPMNDTQFMRYTKAMLDDENAYYILDIVDYENDITMEDIEDAARFLNIPLFETVAQPHLTMDKSKVVLTPEPVPVGWVHVKRTQQTTMKKTGISTSIDSRGATTNQVTGGDKNGRETDLENSMLISIGLEDTLRELNGPRADDSVMKSEMLQQIATKGYVELNSLTYDVDNKTTLNTINVFMIGMGLKSDLVTNGYMLKKQKNEELK